MTDVRNDISENQQIGEAAADGFSLNFTEGRGVLSAGPVHLSKMVTIDRMELWIPDLKFPFDLPDGIWGLRHRRLVLARLEVTVFADPLEALLRKRIDAHTFLKLWSLSFEADFVEVLISYGPKPSAESVPISFRLAPTVVDDRLGAVIENPMAFGPLSLNLLFAAAAAVESMIGAKPKGVDVPMPNIVKDLLFQIMAARGWRLPDYSETQLTHLRLFPERATLSFAHPDLCQGESVTLFENDASQLARLRIQEENQVVRHGDQCITEERFPDARAAYARILDRTPESPFAVSRLAMVDVVNPDLRESTLSLLEEMRARHPDRMDLIAPLIQGRALSERTDLEVPLLHHVSEKGSHLEQLAACIRLGEMLIACEPHKAVAALEQALAVRRDDPRALAALIRALAKVEDTERVHLLIPRWVAATPHGKARAETHAAAGEIMLALNDPTEASRYFERALLASPKNTVALGGVAKSARIRGDLERAVRYFERLERIEMEEGRLSNAADALAALAEIWLEKGERSLALQRLSEALDLYPEHPERRFRYAQLLVQSSRSRDAAKELEAVLRASSASKSAPWYSEACTMLARIYLDELADPEAARHFAREAASSSAHRNELKEIIERAIDKQALGDEAAVRNLSPLQIRQLAGDLRLIGKTEASLDILERGTAMYLENVEIADELIIEAREVEDHHRLFKALTDRVDTVVSAKRRAVMEAELGRLNLEVFNNPSAALCWFKSALDKVESPDARSGMGQAFNILNGQAEALLSQGETEAADTLFKLIHAEAPDNDIREAQLDAAQKMFNFGELQIAYDLAVQLLGTHSDIRKEAALLVANVLKNKDKLDEAVAVLERTAVGLATESAIPLLLLAIEISPKAIANREQVLTTLMLNLRDDAMRPNLDQAIIKLLAMTGDRTTLADYLVSSDQGKNDPERLRRAARLFLKAGKISHAVRVLESLYRRTDAIEDLFLLADALKHQGEIEVLIGILEERRNEDPRVARMLKQELSLYSAHLQRQSVIGEVPLYHADLGPIEMDEDEAEEVDLLRDSGCDLDLKLRNAFNILKKKD